jgi:SAM-dependent methyltransferase
MRNNLAGVTLKSRRSALLREAAFLLRGLLFVGRRYECPCCGWRLRAFTTKRGVLARSDSGYCPRCNAKARHRRLWLYLTAHASLGEPGLRLLEVAPWWSLSRALRQVPGLHYTSVDLVRSHDGVTDIGDVTALRFADASFDALLCIHVLEHVTDDRRAMSELHRVLRPGGWAIVSVPIRLDSDTHEDPTVTSPEERLRLFGEKGHVRFYGRDFRNRLEGAGFEVSMDPAEAVPADVRRRFGLRADENLFHCRRRGG